MAIDSNYTIDYNLAYSIQLAGVGEFEKALDALNELLTKNHRRIKQVLSQPKEEKSLTSLL